ncbi:MAG: DUF6502 family protein [Planctomycetota bacterium]
MTDPTPDSTEEALLTATSQILKPLVRVLLRNGVPCAAVTDLVRRAAVGVAHDEFGLEDRPPTQARISVLTGLHRKEVSRLLKERAADEPASLERRSRAASLLGAWLRDPEFHGEDGRPRALPFTGPSSFTELCKRHSGDMKPRSIANELLSAGALEEVDGALRMTARGYVPGKDPVEMLRILGTDTAEFIETVDHNVRADDATPRRYQSKVQYDNVPAEHVEAFRALAAERGRALLEELDRWLSERDRGEEPAEGERRVSLGLGVFQTEGKSPHDEHRSGGAGPRMEPT